MLVDDAVEGRGFEGVSNFPAWVTDILVIPLPTGGKESGQTSLRVVFNQ